MKPFFTLDVLPVPTYATGRTNEDTKPSAAALKKSKESYDVVYPDLGPNEAFQNKDFIADSTFEVKEIFETLFHGDVLLPRTLPNLPITTRLSYRNKTFVHNFVGLCIWKHINNGDSWVKQTDLNAKKNPENVALFYHHAKVLRLM